MCKRCPHYAPDELGETRRHRERLDRGHPFCYGSAHYGSGGRTYANEPMCARCGATSEHWIHRPTAEAQP